MVGRSFMASFQWSRTDLFPGTAWNNGLRMASYVLVGWCLVGISGFIRSYE